MSFSADNDIISLNFCYYNLIFSIEFLRIADRHVSDLENEVRETNQSVMTNDFLGKIYPEEKQKIRPMKMLILRKE